MTLENSSPKPSDLSRDYSSPSEVGHATLGSVSHEITRVAAGALAHLSNESEASRLPEALHPLNPLRDPSLEAISYAAERSLGSALAFPASLSLEGIEDYYIVREEREVTNPPKVVPLSHEEKSLYPTAVGKRRVLLEREADTIAYPTDRGLMLIAAYYEKKYHIHIKVVSSPAGFEEALHDKEHSSFGIIITAGWGKGHVLPVLCHRPLEGPLQVSLLDSSGNYKVGNDNYLDIAEALPDIQLFKIEEEPRQTDAFSCRTDALCLLRDGLRELQETGSSTLEDFLSPHIKPLSYWGEGVTQTHTLPPSLGKTVQRSSALKGDTSAPVPGKRKESLAKFYERYSRLAPFAWEYYDAKGDLLVSYLFLKTLLLYLNFKGKRNLELVKRLVHDPEVCALAESREALYYLS